MRDLNEQQQKFVLNLVENGGNATKAAIAAGYKAESARQQASMLLNKPHLLAALHEEQRRSLRFLSSVAVGVLKQILKDDGAALAVRLDAAKTVLDRTGLTAKSAEAENIERRVKPLHEMSADELNALVETQRAVVAALETKMDETSKAACPVIALGRSLKIVS